MFSGVPCLGGDSDILALDIAQEEIGSALEKLFSEGALKRQEIWVTSKASVLCSCLGTALTRA